MDKNDEIRMWIDSGFKALVACVCGLVVFSYQELNSTMKDLTIAIRGIEIRVTSIEVDKANYKDDYKRMVQDVKDMKQDMYQLTIRVQEIADFVGRKKHLR